MELVRKKEIVAIVFDLDDKIFVVYVVSFTNFKIDLKVHLFDKLR